jgi:flavin-dependent thymidylate synthase
LIACSAWTSTSRELTEEKKKRIPELLDKLWKDGHETPFEKGMVHFLVNKDIASHIQILKHRLSSENAESARYKELKEDKYYIPEDLYEVWLTEDLYIFDDEMPFYKGNQSWGHVLEEFSVETNRLYHLALKDIEKKLGRKRAKEIARYFKMYNSQIQSDIMFNMRSFANFLKLRKSQHAQLEINEIASQMLELVRQTGKFNHTLNAWGY